MKETNLISRELKLEHWGEGEWMNEPDLIEFEHEGFKCSVARMTGFEGNPGDLHLFGGYLCGYVILPEGHPWFGLDWDDHETMNPDVHAGLTYHAACDNGWEIGFDCAHSMDITPSMEKYFERSKEIGDLKKRFPNSPIWHKSYKNTSFCIAEVKSLAEQAKQVADGK